MSLIAHALPVGSFVDRYRIIRRLAVGGMAEIYLACATGIEGFEKRVVLKRILPQFLDRPEFVGMFLDEARLAATLHHPNIAQVYDIGCDGDTYYFTMEFVEGRDVRHIKKRCAALDQDIPLDQTVAVTMGVAAGLHAAHEKRGPDGMPLGIVHRDVSPANVIVTYDGNVKLIDFGIAKASRRQTQTRTGILKGKSCSMSPEQCLAEPLDRRSDIFSLGIMLYELSTGTRLFSGDSEFDIMRQIVDGAVERPSVRRPEYPAELERIVLRALARDPDERYQTAQEMFVDLDCFARESRLAVSPYMLAEYLAELFPMQDKTAGEGASPPLFLLGDDAELPDELRKLVGADDDESGDSIDIEISGEFETEDVRLERASTIDFAIHQAAMRRAASSDDVDDVRDTVDMRAASPESDDELDSTLRRATTQALHGSGERRLPSEHQTSLVRVRETRAPSVGVFHSPLSLVAMAASLALAVAVIGFGLFSEYGWFARAGAADRDASFEGAVAEPMASSPGAPAFRQVKVAPLESATPAPAVTELAAGPLADVGENPGDPNAEPGPTRDEPSAETASAGDRTEARKRTERKVKRVPAPAPAVDLDPPAALGAPAPAPDLTGATVQ